MLRVSLVDTLARFSSLYDYISACGERVVGQANCVHFAMNLTYIKLVRLHNSFYFQ